jgi:hypothetical protein
MPGRRPAGRRANPSRLQVARAVVRRATRRSPVAGQRGTGQWCDVARVLRWPAGVVERVPIDGSMRVLCPTCCCSRRPTLLQHGWRHVTPRSEGSAGTPVHIPAGRHRSGAGGNPGIPLAASWPAGHLSASPDTRCHMTRTWVRCTATTGVRRLAWWRCPMIARGPGNASPRRAT